MQNIKMYCYNYFLAFYRDDSAASGWNNLVFPNVGMPHVLWQSGGVNRLVSTEYDDHEKAQAAAIGAKSLGAAGAREEQQVRGRDARSGDARNALVAEYQQMVSDLVNFLDYMAEPAKNKRIRLGLVVLLYLGVLFFFALPAQTRILEGRPLATIVKAVAKLLRGPAASLCPRSALAVRPSTISGLAAGRRASGPLATLCIAPIAASAWWTFGSSLPLSHPD